MLNESKWMEHKLQKCHIYIICDDAIIDSKDTGAREKNKYTGYTFLYF